MSELRVLSYNVRSLRDSAADVATVVRDVDPDVVCVQEAPRFWGWRRECRQLARDCELVVVTGGRPAGAMLLLARPTMRVTARRNVKLPWTIGRHRRGLAIGVFDIGGQPVTVASLHFSLFDDERAAHLPMVFAAVRASGHPVVLAGDVNETPDRPVWLALAADYHDAYEVAPAGPRETYSAANPHKRIDGIFVDHRLQVVSCTAVDHPKVATASDHRPVFAVIRTDSAAPESEQV